MKTNGGLAAARLAARRSVLIGVAAIALAGGGTPPADDRLKSPSGSAESTGGGPGRGGGPWWRRYPAIDDKEADRFLELALRQGEVWLGTPAVPIRKVRLHLSYPAAESSPGLASGFRLTEITDAARGEFTIYVSARPGEPAFHGQLAHEAFHVAHPYFRDVYIEGLNTYLALKLLERQRLPWTHWEEHFREGRDPLYGAAYFLVKELARRVGEAEVRRLVRFKKRRQEPDRPGKNQRPNPRPRVESVDVDRWLESLDSPRRRAARAAILERWQKIETTRKRTHRDYAFRRPGPMPRPQGERKASCGDRRESG